MLKQLVITENSVEAPIRSSMDVVEVGRLASGLPVYTDRQAYSADKVIVINRVKPHTAFRGAIIREEPGHPLQPGRRFAR